MRIMWFVNDPLPVLSRHLGRATGGSGSWMPNLLEQLVRIPGVTLDVVTAAQGLPDYQYSEGGVNYFVIGQPRFYPFFKHRQRDIERSVEIIRERRPDLVHIHGTERFFGLIPARGLVTTPCVISLQGLMEPYVPALFGALSPLDLFRSQRFIEIVTRRGLFWKYRDFVHGARREREILTGARSFMGRTDWDRAWVSSASATADYFHVGEVLRPAFEQHRWDISQCERHSLIFTNAGEPRRGTEILLKAIDHRPARISRREVAAGRPYREPSRIRAFPAADHRRKRFIRGSRISRTFRRERDGAGTLPSSRVRHIVLYREQPKQPLRGNASRLALRSDLRRWNSKSRRTQANGTLISTWRCAASCGCDHAHLPGGRPGQPTGSGCPDRGVGTACAAASRIPAAPCLQRCNSQLSRSTKGI